MSSAEVRRLWEEPAEETGPTSGSVGILALQGEEDVNCSLTACLPWPELERRTYARPRPLELDRVELAVSLIIKTLVIRGTLVALVTLSA